MKKLDLNYLEVPKDHPILEILKNYGEQISNYTNGYISYITTSAGEIRGQVNSASLYIVAPEINRQHQLVTINNRNSGTIHIIIWGLSGQCDPHSVEIKGNNYSNLDTKVGELLDDSIAKNIIKLFIEQTKIKIRANNKNDFSINHKRI